MNDSKKSYSGSNAPSPRPQWMKPDDDQPIVGRVVSVGVGASPEDKVPNKQPPTDTATAQLSATHDGNASTGDEPLGKIGRSKLAILTTVFVVAGVLGVPLILYSPVFSKIEKVVWSTLATLYSGVLLYILYRVVVWFLAQI